VQEYGKVAAINIGDKEVTVIRKEAELGGK
jgi:hypothetical protein